MIGNPYLLGARAVGRAPTSARDFGPTLHEHAVAVRRLKPGEGHAHEVGEALQSVVASWPAEYVPADAMEREMSIIREVAWIYENGLDDGVGDSVASKEASAPRIVLRRHADRMRDSMRPRQPVVPGLVSRGEVSSIVANPKSGKSFVALDAAYAVAGGGSFAGQRCAGGNVLYVATDSPGSVERRMLGAGAVGEQIATIASWRADSAGFQDLREALTAEAAAGRAVSLIVADTYDSLRPHGGGGWAENDLEAELVLGHFRALAHDFQIGVVIVHHGVRADGGRARGSQVFEAKLDALLVVEREGHVLTLKRVQARDDEPAVIGSAVIEEVVLPNGEKVGRLKWLLAGVEVSPVDGSGVTAMTLLKYVVTRDGKHTARSLQEALGMTARRLTTLAEELRGKGLLARGTYEPTDAGRQEIDDQLSPEEDRSTYLLSGDSGTESGTAVPPSCGTRNNPVPAAVPVRTGVEHWSRCSGVPLSMESGTGTDPEWVDENDLVVIRP